jgi:AMP deaminase
VARDLEDRRSHYEPSVGAVLDEGDLTFKLEEHDFVPHFQRVSVSGEDTSGVSSSVFCSFGESNELQNDPET